MSPAMQKAVPNQSLIKHLVESYYLGAAGREQRGLVSSHWEYYSNLFQVAINKEGNLTELSGVGFGACQWTGLPHRILDQLCVISHLIHLPRKVQILRLRRVAARLCKAMGLDPTLDVLRQVYSLDLINRHIPANMIAKRLSVLMIGDGYGVLSALFKSVFPNSSIVLVDIGKTLLFQAYYCQKAYPGLEHVLVDLVTDLDQADFVYCPSEDLDRLGKFKFDLAINITSMQEMNMATIIRYFDFLRQHLHRDNLFYCCNRESKTMPGGEVSRFLDYPWCSKDQYLVDETCQWNRYYFQWRDAENRPRFLGVPVPLFSLYDGKIVHRLARLATL